MQLEINSLKFFAAREIAHFQNYLCAFGTRLRFALA